MNQKNQRKTIYFPDSTLRFTGWFNVIKRLKQFISILPDETMNELQWSVDIEIIEYKLGQTEAGIRLLTKTNIAEKCFATKVFSLPNSFIQRAKSDILFNKKELIQLALSLETIESAKKWLLVSKEKTLEDIFANTPSTEYCTKKIKQTIDLKTELVLTPPGSALDKIRQKLDALNKKTKRTVQQLSRHSKYSEGIREHLFVMRNNRYVIPIQRGFPVEKERIIDYSESGATMFVEPEELLRNNNELIALEKQKTLEEKIILSALHKIIRQHANAITINYKHFAKFNLIVSQARMACEFDAERPTPNNQNDFRLYSAIHPDLLESKKHQATRNDILFETKYWTLLISGPNAGGKTYTLKTLGLFCLMMQAGFFLPAKKNTSLSPRTSIFISNNNVAYPDLSSFGSELKNIGEILNQVSSTDLVLLDEPISNTSPRDGGALASSILEWLNTNKIKTAISTHFDNVKTYFLNSPGYRNAYFSLDNTKKNLSCPSHRLQYGQHGASCGLIVAKHLGFLASSLLKRAQEIKNSWSSTKELKLDNLEMEEHNFACRKKKFSVLEAEHKKKAMALSKEQEKFEKQAQEWQQQKNQEKKNEILSQRKELASLKQQFKNLQNSMQKNNIQTINQEQKLLHERLNTFNLTLEKKLRKLSIVANTPTHFPKNQSPAWTKGDAVIAIDFGLHGVIEEILDTKRARIKTPSMSLVVSLSRLQKTQNNIIQKQNVSLHSSITNMADNLDELHIRGKPIDEAIFLAKQYINELVHLGIPSGRIVHGKGTGILSKAMHNMLSKNKHIDNFHFALPEQGSFGVTEIHLKSKTS